LQIFDISDGSNRLRPPSKDGEAGGTRHIATARRFIRKCSMRYDELTIDGVNLVLVHGDIAGESRRRLVDHVRALLMDGRRRIVLDLSAVRHVDSRGLGELIECYEAARAVGGDVKLLGVNGRVSELLVITKLVSVFECFDTRGAALASFAPVPVPIHVPAAVAAAAH